MANTRRTPPRKRDKRAELTPRQRLFCIAYVSVAKFSAKKAAIHAGYSPHSAVKKGYELLRLQKVDDFIKAEMVRIGAKYDLTKERVMRELAYLIYYNLQDFYDNEGLFIPLRKLPREVAAAVSGIEAEQYYTQIGKIKLVRTSTQKIKMPSKVEAMRLAAELMGWKEPDKNELTGKNGQPLFPTEDLSGWSDEDLRAMSALKKKYAAK